MANLLTHGLQFVAVVVAPDKGVMLRTNGKRQETDLRVVAREARKRDLRCVTMSLPGSYI